MKGFRSPILHFYACLLLCFILVLASLILGFALTPLVGLWLCGYIRHPWGPVWMQPLGTHRHDVGCIVRTFPSFHFVRWYACHACLCYPLALYASLHAFLHVHAWVLLASVSFMLQHNEVMDIRSKPTFVPRRHHLLFIFLLVCFPACLLASLLAMTIVLIHFMPVHMLFASFPSIACLLVSCLCLCMYTHGTRMLGVRAQFPRHKQKGGSRKHVDKPSNCVE